jgi:GntR family transcriptional regulator, histidine utilization repressor
MVPTGRKVKRTRRVRQKRTAFRLDGEGALFRQIERSVTDLILKGELKVGDQLPPEAALVDIFKTSRQTVNKAITELAKHGIVERNRRAGTVVSWRFQERFTVPFIDVKDAVTQSGHIYEFRIHARKILRNGHAGVMWSVLPRDARLLYIEGLHLSDGLPVQLETRFVNLDAAPRIQEESFADMTPSKWLLANVPWSDAIHTVHAINAGEALAAKLSLPAGAACLVIDRQTFLLGKPITLVHMTYPGDRLPITGTMSVNGAPANALRDAP